MICVNQNYLPQVISFPLNPVSISQTHTQVSTGEHKMTEGCEGYLPQAGAFECGTDGVSCGHKWVERALTFFFEVKD